MKNKLTITTLLLLLCTGAFTVAWGQPAGFRPAVKIPFQDSIPAREKLVFYFPLAKHILWKDYKQNAETLNRLQEILTEDNIPLISRIVVVGSSSPEGNDKENINLSRLRASEIRGYCRWKFPLLIERDVPFSLRMEPFEVTIEVLRDAILAKGPMPCNSLPAILDSAQTPATKMFRILEECDVTTYRCIVDNFCGEMRYAVAYIIYREDEERLATEQQKEQKITAQENRPIEPEQAGEEMPVVPATPTSTPNLQSEAHTSDRSDKRTGIPSNRKSDPKRAVFAVKTNLLFDLATAVNASIEFPLGSRWSISAEAVFPQWNFNNRYCITLTEVSLEPRLWLGNRKTLRSGKQRNRLTGHFIGVYGSYVQNYDLQWQDKGVMGNGYGTGLTYGYSHRLGRSFNMEYSIGAGALYLENKSYDVSDEYGYKVLRKERSGWHILPTRAKVSLVWLIGNTRNNTK